jgi:hypothetical protein
LNYEGYFRECENQQQSCWATRVKHMDNWYDFLLLACALYAILVLHDLNPLRSRAKGVRGYTYKYLVDSKKPITLRIAKLVVFLVMIATAIAIAKYCKNLR